MNDMQEVIKSEEIEALHEMVEPVFSKEFLSFLTELVSVAVRVDGTAKKENEKDLLEILEMLYLFQEHIEDGEGKLQAINNPWMGEVIGRLSHLLDWKFRPQFVVIL